MRACNTTAPAAAAVALLCLALLTGCAVEQETDGTSGAPPSPSVVASSPAGASTEVSPSPGAFLPSAPPALEGEELDRLDQQLQRAAADNDAGQIAKLLDRGAELEHRNAEGRTPLVTATKANNIDAARALIEAGADVNAKDNIDDSAYLYAGAEGFDGILQLTLEHGADLSSTNRFGGTALIPACEHAHTSTVRILIDAGVDIDHVNTPGWTCLLEAVVFGTGSEAYQDTVRQVIAAEADLSIPDANGVTALQHAQALGQTEVAALLRRAGAR